VGLFVLNMKKGYIRSKEWKRKQHEIHKGKRYTPITDEIIAKLKKARIGRKPSLGKHWKLSDEHKKKISEEHKGEKHWNWKDGRAKTRTLEYKEKIAGRQKPKNCEICGAIGKIDFDHDHVTGKFRGWICRRCNLVLGMVKDNGELLNALAGYLKK